jgi:site-specific recombinase XerD
LISAEDYTDAVSVKSIKGASLPTGRALAEEEIAALFTTCITDKSHRGRRDSALLAVLCGGGLRRSEVVSLDVHHYDGKSGALTVRQGKGRKDRRVFMVGGAVPALRDWLAVRGMEPGPLFVRIRRWNAVTSARLTDQAVLCILRHRQKQAGTAAFSPHDLRRTFITSLFAGGADGATIQKLAGHADIKTSAQYDRRGDTALREASALIKIPYPE